MPKRPDPLVGSSSAPMLARVFVNCVLISLHSKISEAVGRFEGVTTSIFLITAAKSEL